MKNVLASLAVLSLVVFTIPTIQRELSNWEFQVATAEESVPSVSPEVSPSPTPTPSILINPSVSPTPTPSVAPSTSPSPSPSVVPTRTPTPTPDLYIKMMSPNGGEKLSIGRNSLVTTNAKEFDRNVRLAFYLYNWEKGKDVLLGSLVPVINSPISPNFMWQVGQYKDANGDVKTAPDKSGYKIMVKDLDTEKTDFSNGYFTLLESDLEIAVTSPNGGEIYLEGENRSINFYSGKSKKVDIYLQNFDTGEKKLVAKNYKVKENTEVSYPWTVPEAFGYKAGGGFLVIACDHSSSKKQSCDESDSYFKINPKEAPFLRVITPNGGETYSAGKTTNIKWTSNMATSVPLTIVLRDKNDGISKVIENATENDGTYHWVIPDDIVPPGTVGAFKIWVGTFGKDPLADDMSDTTFNVEGLPVNEPSITILSPNGGEKWQAGNTYSITWKKENVFGEGVSLWATRDDCGSCEVIITPSNATNTGYYEWKIPANITSSNQYRVHVYAKDGLGGDVTDMSDATFSITSEYCYYFDTNNLVPLTLGSSGPQVAYLQDYLIKEGYLILPPDTDKGYFGILTKTALIKLQQDANINLLPENYGSFGQETAQWINNNASCGIPDIIVESVSNSAIVDEFPEAGENGLFNITFDVTAINEDYFLYKSAQRANAGGAGVIYTIYKNGIASEIDGLGRTVSAESGTESGDTNDYYIIREGETRRFTLHIRIDPTETAMYKVGIKSILYDLTEDDFTFEDQVYVLPNPGLFETNTIRIHA